MRPLIIVMLAVALGATAPVADAAVYNFIASLSGTEAVPGPGDSDGSGTVTLKVNTRKHKVCQVMRLKRVPDSQIANIRRGRRGTAGPIVVDLDLFGRVTRSCTIAVPGDDLRAIVRHPGRFYVNVTSDSHPRSAVRGQLQRAPDDGNGPPPPDPGTPPGGG